MLERPSFKHIPVLYVSPWIQASIWKFNVWKASVYLEGNAGIIMHAKYFRLITVGKVLDVIFVGLNGVSIRSIVDTCYM